MRTNLTTKSIQKAAKSSIFSIYVKCHLLRIAPVGNLPYIYFKIWFPIIILVTRSAICEIAPWQVGNLPYI